jgi:hypothetical protein
LWLGDKPHSLFFLGYSIFNTFEGLTIFYNTFVHVRSLTNSGPRGITPFKTRAAFVIITLIAIGIVSFASLPFPSSIAAKSKFDFSGVPDILVVVNEGSTRYRINPDYTSFFDDITGNQLIRNNDARDAKKLHIDPGDTLTLSFDCEECSFVADVAVYLVDGNIRDRDIADGGDSPVIIEISHIDCNLQNCHEPFEVIIPNDLDTGKYKIVIDRDEDEGHYLYINGVRVLQG